jgi:hypothetical protein
MLRYFTAVIALAIGLGASAQKSEAQTSFILEPVSNENIQTSSWKSDDGVMEALSQPIRHNRARCVLRR